MLDTHIYEQKTGFISCLYRCSIPDKTVVYNATVVLFAVKCQIIANESSFREKGIVCSVSFSWHFTLSEAILQKMNFFSFYCLDAENALMITSKVLMDEIYPLLTWYLFSWVCYVNLTVVFSRTE